MGRARKKFKIVEVVMVVSVSKPADNTWQLLDRTSDWQFEALYF